MSDDVKLKEETVRAFRKFGFSWDHESEKSDFEMVCCGLNLFLCICGNGVKVVQTSTLGDRVRLAEVIVTALEDVGCKVGLQAHQVSGLDWRAIHPVVDWMGYQAEIKREDAKHYADEFLDKTRERRRNRLATSDQGKERWTNESTLALYISTLSVDSQNYEGLRLRIEEQRRSIQAAEVELEFISELGSELRGKIGGKDDHTLKNFNAISTLVEENEQLKTMEKEFRASCRHEKERLLGKLEILNAEISDAEEETKALMDAKDRINARLARNRVNFAGISRFQATETREEDDRPTREELVQFERQFSELYEHMTQKSDEHRRHVATYNALETRLRLLRDQVLLIQSISDSFLASKSTLTSAGEFLKQFSQVLSGFEKSVERSQTKLIQIRKERDAAESELQALLLKQRRYYRAVRELQDAFVENEKLVQNCG